jgi:chorismate mutase/prephenate dehydratase
VRFVIEWFGMSQVAYLGPEGTFSGILARQRFGKKADLIASAAIEGVFESVLSGATPLGLVPVENSSGGTVYDTIDLLIRHAGSIYIVEELARDIRIALLGRKGTPVKTV